MCSYAEACTEHNGRNKYCLFIPQINTSVGKNEFPIMHAWSCIIWNS